MSTGLLTSHASHAGTCSCAPPPHLALLADLPRLSACPAPRPPRRVPPPGATAELLLRGQFRTMNPAQPTAEAVAVREGRIVGIGSAAEVGALVDASTIVLDLDGVSYPGLIEPHMHFWASALMLDWLRLSPVDGLSFDDVVNVLRQAPPTIENWKLGQLYDPSLIPGNRELDRDLLDQICPDHPVLVMNASMHFAYLNSKALEASHIDEKISDPVGGRFGRYPDGRLNGVLAEYPAIAQAFPAVPRLGKDQVVDRLVQISKDAAASGVTHGHDAGTGGLFGAGELALFEHAKGRLACRASYAIIDEAADQVLNDSGVRSGDGDDWVRAVHWKIISDGSNQGYTGYQRENYLNSKSRGEPNCSTEYLVERMTKAAAAGWPIMVHANGDAAIGQVIEAYRMAIGTTSGLAARHRIEHCSFPADDDLAAMSELGLSPSFLMNHVYYWGRAFREDIVGQAKAERLDPVASALGHGLRPTFHSDYTVTNIHPLLAVQTAVTRQERDGGNVLNPSERISAYDAMQCVTRNAAWQLHADQDAGSLEVGKLADVTMLSADPCEVDVDSIGEISVLGTLLGGEPR